MLSTLAVGAFAACSSGTVSDSGSGASRATSSSGNSSSGNSSSGNSSSGGSSCAPSGYPLTQSSVARVPAESIPTATLDAAVTANNAFALDLYKQVIADPTVGAGNVVTSPVSGSLALTMAYAGAKNETATQMASVLHIPATPSIFDGQNALSQALASRAPAALAQAQTAAGASNTPPSPSDYQLNIVNSVWGEKAYPWESSFLDVLAKDYGTGIYSADFYAQFDPARQAINQWVSCETAGKIQDLLLPGTLTCLTRMVLVNAIHLKLPWAQPFEKYADVTSSFTTGKGATVTTTFMKQMGSFAYVDDGQAQIVALPLSGNQLSLVVALPHGSLSTYEAALTAGSAALSAPTSGQPGPVFLTLPKFNFTSPPLSWVKYLEALGMVVPFSDAADFTGLVADPNQPGQPPNCISTLKISDVLQKATLAVQETGVEAAAATAVIIGGASSSASGPSPVTMIVNRPFLFSIVDQPTGAVLFLGHVEDPTDAGGP
jgi:serpin B